MSVVVIGSANTDLIIQTPHIPAPGETILGSEYHIASGGKGANQAVAAKRLGAEVSFIANIGKDNFGDELIQNYQNEGINIDHITRSNVHSGIAMIHVAEDGENAIAVASGSNAQLLPNDILSNEALFRQSNYVICQLETPLETVLSAAKLAKKTGNIFILNPAPATTLPDELYPLIDIISPNETEAKMLTGITVTSEESAREAAQVFKEKGVKNSIITLGEKGAFLYNEAGFALIPAHKVKALDTTAAGDTFNGALVASLASGKTLSQSVAFANLAASLSVMKLGAQPSIPYLKELTSS
ncbi:ribokinase [Fangia hongkongensis]|uniref:ribokinase n=1 Tax=Fangia hongkongensis TaxID=270495 RepID=UPI000376324A|nr:ribokinase [Fangia hongkongensis]MBK2124309.1 ribokinase [Fangia hongkongensis]